MAFFLQKLDHVVFRTTRLDEAVRFYQEVLGATLERVVDDAGLYQLRAGSALIDLVPIDSRLGRAGGGAPDPDGRNVDHVCFTIEPWDEPALLAWLDGHDVEHSPVEQRYGAEGFGPSIYITDPDGNTVELKGPPDEPPSARR